MKNHRFPWLRNRTTDNRKCEKACNIKEKRTIEMFKIRLKGCSSRTSVLQEIIYSLIMLKKLGNTPFPGFFHTQNPPGLFGFDGI